MSSGPRRDNGTWWPGPDRSHWIAILVLGGVLTCLGLIMGLALQVTHQNNTISKLHAAARNASKSAPATAAQATIEATVAYTLPDTADGSYSVVAVGIRPRPGSAVLTWLFVYGRHVHSGERYGLRQATCTGQDVTRSDLADGTADQDGNLTIVAPNLAITPQEGAWVEVYRSTDSTGLGGIQGPPLGRGAGTFRDAPTC